MSDSKTTSALEERIAALRDRAATLREQLAHVFLGQEAVVEELLGCVVAGGHALIEGAPGLGKTTLVKGLAATLDLNFQRAQFTPDLMPADILGMRVLEEGGGGKPSFRFERGPVFTNVLLADEINRATPRTQAALLEAMQEQQVTTFGTTMPLDDPFFVVATQNPIEMEGTYPLPEAQLDRFIAKVEIRSPERKELIAILNATTGALAPAPKAVLSAEEVRELRTLARSVPASSDVVALVAGIVLATDPSRASSPDVVRSNLRFGSSPRGGQAILQLSKARALLAGRPWVSDEDVHATVRPALRHRLVFSFEGEAGDVTADQLVDAALEAAQRA